MISVGHSANLIWLFLVHFRCRNNRHYLLPSQETLQPRKQSRNAIQRLAVPGYFRRKSLPEDRQRLEHGWRCRRCLPRSGCRPHLPQAPHCGGRQHSHCWRTRTHRTGWNSCVNAKANRKEGWRRKTFRCTVDKGGHQEDAL